MDFADSVYARDFFQHQIPTMINTLKRIADNQEKMIGDQVDTAKTEPSKKAKPEQAVQAEVGKVYVCYEENSAALYAEAGNINHMFVTADIEQARQWATRSIEYARAGKYLPIDEAEQEQFFADIGNERSASVWVYLGRREDERINYGICVDSFDLSESAEHLQSIFN